MTYTIPSDYVPNKVRGLIEQTVYARKEYGDVLTMVLAVSHAREAFTAVPLVLATSEKPASGKSTFAADIPLLLAFNGWKINRLTTIDAMRSKYLERARPNPVLDDAGKTFGDTGMNGRLSWVYTLLIDCYTEDGVVEVSRNGTNQRLSSYGVAFMNGLKNSVPPDLFTRCIHFGSFEAVPEGIELRDTKSKSVRADAKLLQEALHSWASGHKDELTAFMAGPVKYIHPKLIGRLRQIWGPVFAMASVAGGDWPRRIYRAFVLMALDAADQPSLVAEQKLLLDAAEIIMREGLDKVFSVDLMARLRALPTGTYYRAVDDKTLLRYKFPEAIGQPETITVRGVGKGLGYRAAPILEAAADLRDAIEPKMERVDDPLEAEFAIRPLTPITPIRTAA
jgi:hypothetical protein